MFAVRVTTTTSNPFQLTDCLLVCVSWAVTGVSRLACPAGPQSHNNCNYCRSSPAGGTHTQECTTGGRAYLHPLQLPTQTTPINPPHTTTPQRTRRLSSAICRSTDTRWRCVHVSDSLTYSSHTSEDRAPCSGMKQRSMCWRRAQRTYSTIYRPDMSH
jgi:hypothetical protein